MDDITRREAITALGGSAFFSPEMSDQQPQEKPPQLTADQKIVMEAGLTRKEAECWKLIAQAAGAFFALPNLHPMDKQEVSSAIHIVQNKLLSRPTYRKYLELAKAAHKKNMKETKD